MEGVQYTEIEIEIALLMTVTSVFLKLTIRNTTTLSCRLRGLISTGATLDADIFYRS